MKNTEIFSIDEIENIFGIPHAQSLEMISILFGGDQKILFDFLKTNNINLLFPELDNNVLGLMNKDKIEYCTEKDCVFKTYEKGFHDFFGDLSNKTSEFGCGLKKHIEKIISFKIKVSFEKFHSHLCLDKIMLMANFRFDLSKIISIVFHGDPHNFGSQVLEIKDSNDVVIFYKPRSIDGFVIIKKIFDLLNDKFQMSLYCPDVIIRDGYGWLRKIEFIEVNLDLDPSKAKTYGGLIAVAHFLGLSDLHFENVKWSDIGLVIIDIDVMFRAIETSDIDELAGYSLPHSTGLLPYNDILGKSHNTISISKTETAYLISNSYQDAINFIIQDKKLIDFVIGNTKNLICRYIPRNTATYSQVSDLIKRDCLNNNSVFFLRVISNLAPAIKVKPLLEKFLMSEIYQLLNFDIPIFYRKVASNEACNFNHEPMYNGLSFFEHKLNAFNHELINVSHVLTLQSFLVSLKKNQAFSLKELFPLDSLMFENNNHATYVSYCMHGAQWSVFPMGVDLYSGLSGVLLKEVICCQTESANKKCLIDKIAQTINHKILHSVSGEHIGYLSGLTGSLLSLSLYMYYTSVQNIDLRAIHKKISKKYINLDKLDFYDGIAGIICSYHLIRKYCKFEYFDDFLSFICSDFLEKVKQIHCFSNSEFDCGIAHGISGVCLALNISKMYIVNCESEVVDSIIFRLLELETDKLLSIEEDNFSAWCKGAAGMIQVRKLLNHKYKMEELVIKHQKYKSDMGGWCHGVHSSMIFGEIVDNENSITQWSAPFRQYSLGLFTGDAGIHLSHLYIHLNDTKHKHIKELIHDLLIPS